MIQYTRMIFAAWILIGFVGYTYAQTEDAMQEQDTSQEQVEPVEQSETMNPAVTIDELAEPSPPPGEEVMRPTKHGIRLTPALARFISEKSIDALDDMLLTDDQKSELTEVTARRWMQAGHDHGKEACEFIEFLYEALIRGQGKIVPEDAQEFAKRVKAAMPALEDFDDSLEEDWRPILDDEQWERMEQMDKKFQKGIDLFKAKMDEWEKGNLTEAANPFEELAKEMEDQGNTSHSIGKTEKARRFAARARFQMIRFGPEQWGRFLRQVQTSFKFDEEQIAQGRDLLKKYNKKLAVIRTPQWRKRALVNRTKYAMREVFEGQAILPWLHQLNREYDEMTKPIGELDQAFRQEVMALATDDQRQAVLTELQELGAKYGLATDEMTPKILHLIKPEHP